MKLTRFTPAMTGVWNSFNLSARNGMFMFDRSYMDYHADRFEDHSLLLFKDEKLLAILPGNARNGTYFSHQGLTFGGFITSSEVTAGMMLESFDLLAAYLRSENFEKIFYKCIPYIYHAYPSQDDVYALFRHNAQLTRVDVSTVIDLSHPYPLNKGKRSAANKARRLGVVIQPSGDLDVFFGLLNERLSDRYQTQSTHTADEMRLLMARFPDQIRLYTAHLGADMVGGVIAYISEKVVHTQYIARTEAGARSGANELVIETMIEAFSASHRYFDFGISNEDQGRYLNLGLVGQKEHFGGRSIVHQFFELVL